MTIVNTLDLDAVHLDKGGHDSHKPGEWCVMEAVAWVAGEPWTDRPNCVSPVISAYCMRLNDRLDDDNRQRLAPYIYKVIGTNTGAADDEQRRLLAATKFATLLPAWLDAAGLPEAADRIRALGILTTHEQWIAARSELRAVRDLAWNKRWEARAPLRDKITEAVKAKLAEQPAAAVDAAADADADADAVADAVAAAVAAAAAAAAADAAADADAVADAVAVAVAAAAAVAAAVAVAAAAAVAVAAAAADAAAVADAAAAADNRYWKVRDAVYKALLPVYQRAVAESPVIAGLVQQSRDMGFALLDEMCAVGRD